MRRISTVLLCCVTVSGLCPYLPASGRSIGKLGETMSIAKFDHPLQTSPPADTLRWAPQPSANKVRVILGSQSSTRKLLRVSYQCISPDIDEKAIRKDAPEDLVLALAHAKADALLKRPDLSALWSPNDGDTEQSTTLLVTCDQVVVHDGRILEKPHDKEEARTFIRGYGKVDSPCGTVGGIVVTNVNSGKRCEALDKASIYFSEIPEHVISELVDSGDVLYCAGGLMVEAPEVQPYCECGSTSTHDHVASKDVRMSGTISQYCGLKDLWTASWDCRAASLHNSCHVLFNFRSGHEGCGEAMFCKLSNSC